MNAYISDAEYTYASMRDDLILRIDAGSYISDDDWDAYDRAKAAVGQQRALWEHRDGLLDAEHDRVYGGAA